MAGETEQPQIMVSLRGERAFSYQGTQSQRWAAFVYSNQFPLAQMEKTIWYGVLEQHPDIRMPVYREPEQERLGVESQVAAAAWREDGLRRELEVEVARQRAEEVDAARRAAFARKEMEVAVLRRDPNYRSPQEQREMARDVELRKGKEMAAREAQMVLEREQEMAREAQMMLEREQQQQAAREAEVVLEQEQVEEVIETVVVQEVEREVEVEELIAGEEIKPETGGVCLSEVELKTGGVYPPEMEPETGGVYVPEIRPETGGGINDIRPETGGGRIERKQPQRRSRGMSR